MNHYFDYFLVISSTFIRFIFLPHTHLHFKNPSSVLILLSTPRLLSFEKIVHIYKHIYAIKVIFKLGPQHYLTVILRPLRYLAHSFTCPWILYFNRSLGETHHLHTSEKTKAIRCSSFTSLSATLITSCFLKKLFSLILSCSVFSTTWNKCPSPQYPFDSLLTFQKSILSPYFLKKHLLIFTLTSSYRVRHLTLYLVPICVHLRMLITYYLIFMLDFEKLKDTVHLYLTFLYHSLPYSSH